MPTMPETLLPASASCCLPSSRTDSSDEMFGADRLLAALNRRQGMDTMELLKNVNSEVDAFVGDAPQFDDLTMLAFEMK